MAGTKMTLYIKAERNVEVTKSEVTLGDVLTLECAQEEILPKIKVLKLLKFHHTDKKQKNRVAVSIMKVIACIHKEFPNLEIVNLGEADFIVTYEEQQTAGGVFHWVKAAVVTMISFIGAAFSIMAFNNDVDTTRIFGQIYELLTGKASNGFTILEVNYCVGLVIGILTFFNHFGKRKFTVDPTPMEVEMRLYENDIQTTLLETYSRKGKELDVGTADSSGNHWS